MNHIKKRKMLNSIFTSVSVLLIAFFASCDNFSEITYESEIQELYTVSGKLLSPASSYENKNARYAIPDFSSANIVYSVEATNENGTTAKGVFENGTTNFSIKLGLGKWTLKATGTADGKNAVLEGTKEIELTKENPIVSDVSIELFKVYGDGGTGTVELKLKVPPSVKSVEANWTLKSSPETAYIAYFNDVSDTVTIDTYDTNGKKDFSAGAYELRLYFWSESDAKNKGTLLYYISSEIVNVFSGMETNIWEGSTEYFSENDGNKTVVITEEKIQNFLHTTFYVGKKDDLQREANDKNPGTYFYPLLKVSEAVKKIQETEKVHHYNSYSIYVYKTEFSDSPEISENVNITIYGEQNSVSGFTMSASGGTLTADNLSVTENIFVTGGNATFSGGSVGGLTVSGGSATLTGTTISGTATVSSGNLTLKDLSANGEITVSDGTLSLENATVNGTTTVSGNGNLNLDNARAKDVNANGGILTADNLSVTENIFVTGGNATFSGGSVGGLTVSGGSATLTGGTLSGNVTVSDNGTLTANNAGISGNVQFNGGILTFNGGSIGGTTTITGGNVTMTGGSVASAEISGGTATLTSTTIGGATNLSNGNLTLSSTTVNGDITYTGGALTLEGSTTVKSGNKITINKNLTIGVKNLSEIKVAEIEDSSTQKKWDSWTNGTTILTLETGTMTDAIISKFTLNDSNKVRVLKVGTDDNTNSAVLGLRTTFYVSANGNDNSDGSEQSAFKTVNKAIEKIKIAEDISHTFYYIINVLGNVEGPADFSTLSTNDMPIILLEGKNSATIKAENSQVIKMPGVPSSSPSTNFLLNISGINLSGGNSAANGSIVEVPENTTLKLSDCEIKDNVVGEKGAVYVSGGDLFFGGKITITGNKTSTPSSQAANVYLARDRKITLDTSSSSSSSSSSPFVSDSKIGVTTETKPTATSPKVQITSDTNTNFISSFSSDEGYTVISETSGLSLAVSSGNISVKQIDDVIFEILPTSLSKTGGDITVKAKVNNTEITDKLSNLNLKIYYFGVDTKATPNNTNKNTINVNGAWPSGTYQLFVSVTYNGITYSSYFDFEKRN